MAVNINDIKAVPALAALSGSDLDLISQLMIRRTYAPGEMIFLEGDPSQGIWFISRGQVRILKLSETGRVQALCVMKPGKCFGGCPLFSMENNPANAQALDEVDLLVLLPDETAYLQNANPALLHILLKIYSERLALLAKLSESLGSWTVVARIDDSLLTYAVQEGEKLLVWLTHEKLAHLAGTVREVVTRHLLELEAQQVIRQEPGCIELVNAEALQSRCILERG